MNLLEIRSNEMFFVLLKLYLYRGSPIESSIESKISEYNTLRRLYIIWHKTKL